MSCVHVLDTRNNFSFGLVDTKLMFMHCMSLAACMLCSSMWLRMNIGVLSLRLIWEFGANGKLLNT